MNLEHVEGVFNAWWLAESGFSYREWLRQKGTMPPLSPRESYVAGWRDGVKAGRRAMEDLEPKEREPVQMIEYECRCSQCGGSFVGPKRAVVCQLCTPKRREN